MDQKGHMIDQKGLKMYEKKQKMEFSDLKYLLFRGIFPSGIGGYPPPPLTKNHPAQKPLAEMGGYPPSTDKIRLVVFASFRKVQFCLIESISRRLLSFKALPLHVLGKNSGNILN